MFDKNSRIIPIVIILIIILFFGLAWLFDNPSKLITPPKIEYTQSKVQENFWGKLLKTCNWTGYKKKLKIACNYTDPSVRNYNVRLASSSPGEFNIGQVCDIFDHYFQNWKYVDDPTGVEYVALASESIFTNFSGDCDDFAVLMTASIISIGGEARLNFADDGNSGHAFSEVNLGTTDIHQVLNYLSIRYLGNTTYHYREDDFGNKWLNLDWFGNHPGGKYFDSRNETMFYVLQNYCQDYSK